MITLISATDRVGSNTLKIAKVYSEILTQKNIDHKLLSLEGFPLYDNQSPQFVEMMSHYLVPADKFIFISPEYNGSYAGVLKVLIDKSNITSCWHHKKALLTGVATGRAGNLRGMEHLTGTLLYLKMIVHPNRLPISQVDKLLNTNGVLDDASTLNVIGQQIEDFITF